MGRLNFAVIGCRQLLNKEAVGKSDPYVIVSYDKKEHRTRTISSNLNPNFNENFLFFINESSGDHYISLVVKDKDTFSDDTIGLARYAVEGLEKGVTKDLQLPLTSPEGAPAGMILVRVCAEDFTTKDMLLAHSTNSGTAAVSPLVAESKPIEPMVTLPSEVHSNAACPPNLQQPPPSTTTSYPPISSPYPPANAAYPPPANGYPPPTGTYPPNSNGYPAQSSYPPSQQAPPYPHNTGYTPPQPYYPQQQQAPVQPYYPQSQPQHQLYGSYGISTSAPPQQQSPVQHHYAMPAYGGGAPPQQQQGYYPQPQQQQGYYPPQQQYGAGPPPPGYPSQQPPQGYGGGPGNYGGSGAPTVGF